MENKNLTNGELVQLALREVPTSTKPSQWWFCVLSPCQRFVVLKVRIYYYILSTKRHALLRIPLLKVVQVGTINELAPALRGMKQQLAPNAQTNYQPAPAGDERIVVRETELNRRHKDYELSKLLLANKTV
jgi:hypothetical protein